VYVNSALISGTVLYGSRPAQSVIMSFLSGYLPESLLLPRTTELEQEHTCLSICVNFFNSNLFGSSFARPGSISRKKDATLIQNCSTLVQGTTSLFQLTLIITTPSKIPIIQGHRLTRQKSPEHRVKYYVIEHRIVYENANARSVQISKSDNSVTLKSTIHPQLRCSLR